jgi:hypothetical protein
LFQLLRTAYYPPEIGEHAGAVGAGGQMRLKGYALAIR